jgi:outer membrane protein TolC
MKHFLLLLLLPFPSLLFCQSKTTLSLREAYNLAEKNYPAIKRKELIRQTAQLSIENLQKGFLPQFALSAQASFQSDVTKLPISLPGLNIESPAKDQYKVVAEVNQLVYDGGITRIQKELQQLSAEVEENKVDVELYQVKDRIKQLFLGALLLDEQMKQVDLVQQDLEVGIKRVEAQVQNGVAFRSNVNLLRAEYLKAGQRTIELKSSRKGFVDALSEFTGIILDERVQLQAEAPSAEIDSVLQRPELKLLDKQAVQIMAQQRLIDARNLPRTSLFGQGGYGRPALNMLQNDFDFYYIVGIRFNWSLSGLYTRKREKELVDISRKTVETQRETFVLTTNAQLRQKAAEITKYAQLVESDNAIIDLRRSVTEAAKAQLENGVITASDFLLQVNAEDQARQLRILHQLQLLQAKLEYYFLTGKE